MTDKREIGDDEITAIEEWLKNYDECYAPETARNGVRNLIKENKSLEAALERAAEWAADHSPFGCMNKEFLLKYFREVEHD